MKDQNEGAATAPNSSIAPGAPNETVGTISATGKAASPSIDDVFADESGFTKNETHAAVP